MFFMGAGVDAHYRFEFGPICFRSFSTYFKEKTKELKVYLLPRNVLVKIERDLLEIQLKLLENGQS